MLKEIGDVVDDQSAKRIKDLLQKNNSKSGHVSNGMPDKSQDQTGSSKRSSSPSSIGSLEAVDRVEEDLNLTESSRATGYMGKSSEITWMGRVQEEAEQRNRGQSPKATSENHTGDKISPTTVNYHIDDLGVDAPGLVQMYWVPPRQVADHLFETYLLAVHPHFPIINSTLFSTQYRDFFDETSYAGDKWMAILNMIFAIATEYLYNSDVAQRRDIKDHLFYLTRARMLSMGGDSLFEHPDLQQVQIEGLIAFHMLSTNQINRAWRISALAIRSATSLGINLKSSCRKMLGVSKEIGCRIWWCLYTVEHTLGSMTGRATSISTNMYTTQLPLPFDEDHLSEPSAKLFLDNFDIREKRVDMAMTSPHIRYPDSQQTEDALAGRLWLQSLPVNSSLYFLYYCDLTVINQEILDQVYSAESAAVSWEDIKGSISRLKATVDAWLLTLPPGLDFTALKDENQKTYWAKTNLAFHYHSTRIVLGRPCLCRHNPNQTDRRRNSTEERGFSHDMAVMTLESAMKMLDLLPDEPSSVHLYQFCPWWCFLHYIMQAATVIILELLFRCVHMPDRQSSLIQSAKKSVRWLYMMSTHCIASHRAWQLCESALRRLVSSMGYDDSDTPQTPNQQPDGLSGDHVDHVPPAQRDGRHDGMQGLSYNGQYQSSIQPHENHDVGHSNNDSDLAGSLAFGILCAPSTEEHTAGDAHFPYDPISQEFIRYLFPSLDGGDNPNGEKHTF
ncbi:Transcription factor, fungi [Penicillium expansum]|nr:Transcription factor, fungi [Penicillium expansum]